MSMCPSGYGSERGMMSRNEGGGKGMLIHFVIILSSTWYKYILSSDGCFYQWSLLCRQHNRWSLGLHHSPSPPFPERRISYQLGYKDLSFQPDYFLSR